MTEKPKRKNAPPTPKAYWWIFGTLALILLIGLRYPIVFTTSEAINGLMYFLIAVTCGLTLVHFVRRYHWKRIIVIVMVLSILLTGINFMNLPINLPLAFSLCESNHYDSVFVSLRCSDLELHYDFAGIRGIPIFVIIETSSWCCCCGLF